MFMKLMTSKGSRQFSPEDKLEKNKSEPAVEGPTVLMKAAAISSALHTTQPTAEGTGQVL